MICIEREVSPYGVFIFPFPQYTYSIYIFFNRVLHLPGFQFIGSGDKYYRGNKSIGHRIKHSHRSCLLAQCKVFETSINQLHVLWPYVNIEGADQRVRSPSCFTYTSAVSLFSR